MEAFRIQQVLCAGFHRFPWFPPGEIASVVWGGTLVEGTDGYILVGRGPLNLPSLYILRESKTRSTLRRILSSQSIIHVDNNHLTIEAMTMTMEAMSPKTKKPRGFLPCECSSHSCSSHSCSSENQVHRVEAIANSRPDNKAVP